MFMKDLFMRTLLLVESNCIQILSHPSSPRKAQREFIFKKLFFTKHVIRQRWHQIKNPALMHTKFQNEIYDYKFSFSARRLLSSYPW